MTGTFTLYSDPAHGWLKVSWKDLKDLGMTARDFSAYSFLDKNGMFLEEDRDASTFLNRYQSVTGKTPKLKESVSTKSSKIRSKDYNSFSNKTTN